MAFKRPSVQFCPAPPDSLKTPDHRIDGRGFLVFGGIHGGMGSLFSGGCGAAFKNINGIISAYYI